MGALKFGKTERKLNDIVYIDIDGDRFDNAIVIDDDEYGSKSSYSNLERHKKVSCVICVDDDDNDDAGCRQTSVRNVGDLDSDASSGRRSFPISNSKLHTIDIDGDGSPVRDEKKFAFKLSRCKQKSSGKVPARNCYGLSFSTYTGSSESDCSDCEVIDSFCEKLQEQWKKDSQKKRTCVPVDDCRADDQASTSSFPSDSKHNANMEKRNEPHLPSPLYCRPNDVDNEEENMSAFSGSGDDFASTILNPKNANSFMESNQTFHQENLSSMEPGLGGESLSNHGMSGRGVFLGDPSPSSDDNGVCGKVHCGVADFKDKECSSERHPSLRANIERVETLQHDGVLLRKDNKFLSGELFCGHASDQALNRYASNSLSVKDGEAGYLNGRACGEGKVGEDGLSLDKRKVNSVFVFQHGEERSDSIKITSGMEAKGSSDTKNIAVAEIREVVPCVGSSIINEREKLKASNEYKAAVEEEWASRKRELQIQAEESQRLRKRKKAETLRLLDMHRRQKERLEEVRETQKKDEENMNLKEKLRAEIMESLSKLEVACIDMASLLRGLGIQVGRGLIPQSQEVHAAYKRALLKFHPDRASRMDVRQQVEAEEKFKLISRMKEKLQQ